MSKKLIFGLIAGLVAAPSFAASLCAGDGKDVDVKAGTGTAVKFIATDFKQKCSNNVISAYDEDNAGAWVASASKKGKSYFMGHTNGGAAIPIPGVTVTAGTDPKPADQLTEAQKLGETTSTTSTTGGGG